MNTKYFNKNTPSFRKPKTLLGAHVKDAQEVGNCRGVDDIYLSALAKLMGIPSCITTIQSLKWMGRRESTKWGGGRAEIQQRLSSRLSCRRPLRAVLARAWMSTLWWFPPSISSADHGVAHPPRFPEGWFERGCRGVWHAQAIRVSPHITTGKL